MARQTYPLESLAALRATRVSGAVSGLARAIASRQRAENARRDVEVQREAHEARAASVASAERGLLAEGKLRAADLAQAHAWQLRAAAERAALTGAVDRALVAEAEAREGEAAARDMLAARRIEADVVDKDRARFSARAQRRQDGKEEEAMAEAFRGRR